MGGRGEELGGVRGVPTGEGEKGRRTQLTFGVTKLVRCILAIISIRGCVRRSVGHTRVEIGQKCQIEK